MEKNKARRFRRVARGGSFGQGGQRRSHGRGKNRQGNKGGSHMPSSGKWILRKGNNKCVKALDDNKLG